MPVITMSRQIGSGADRVAEQLCSDLGLVAFDKRLMLRVASETGFSDNEIVDYSEDQYKLRTFFDALFRRSRTVAEVSSWTGGRAGGYERETRVLDEARAIDLIRSTAVAACERGNVLIIGRGGQAILEDKPGVFHVRVVAPYEYRVQRLCAEREMTTTQARRMISERDRAMAEYLRTFHQVDIDDATLYHIVVNTGLMGVNRSAALIRSQVEAMFPKEAEAGSQ